jgi:hypothetical protein
MARQVHDRDISSTLAAAERWIKTCLIEDRSVFSEKSLWTAQLVDEVYHAFVEHPDFGADDFMTKLKGQMRSASPAAKQLSAEMLWALLLFPSNMKARSKRKQISEIWAMSGQQISDDHPVMLDKVLAGIGSGGPAYFIKHPDELKFLIELTRNLKQKGNTERRTIFGDYRAFVDWIGSVPQEGRRQFRHMLRFFAFPDRVERMSSNNDRRSILEAFDVAPERETKRWTDQQLDDALLKLRSEVTKSNPAVVMDFYAPTIKERWAPERKIKTDKGQVTVTVPADNDDDEDDREPEVKLPEVRRSFQIQAKLVEIGAIMGFKIWVPAVDRGRVRDLVENKYQPALVEDLPLNHDEATLGTIQQIDILWLKGRSIARAFEVEHSTAVYSGLLRMADLLALQPNINIRLHIVAPEERREKVFREMRRPVFSLLDRGPLSRSCTFISYDSVESMRGLEYLAHTNDSIINEYEEQVEA